MASRKATPLRRAQRKLVWTERALRDLRDIDAYIAADDPVAAERWVSKLLAAAERAAKLPYAGHISREKGREDVRQMSSMTAFMWGGALWMASSMLFSSRSTRAV